MQEELPEDTADEKGPVADTISIVADETEEEIDDGKGPQKPEKDSQQNSKNVVKPDRHNDNEDDEKVNASVPKGASEKKDKPAGSGNKEKEDRETDKTIPADVKNDKKVEQKTVDDNSAVVEKEIAEPAAEETVLPADAGDNTENNVKEHKKPEKEEIAAPGNGVKAGNNANDSVEPDQSASDVNDSIGKGLSPGNANNKKTVAAGKTVKTPEK